MESVPPSVPVPPYPFYFYQGPHIPYEIPSAEPINQQAVEADPNVAAQAVPADPAKQKQNGSRMSYKGQPGEEGYMRRLEIVKAMLAYPCKTAFGPVDKGKAYKEVTVALNKDPLFGSKLKEATLVSKWVDNMKIVDKIIFDGEAPFIFQVQNGGKDMH